MGTETKNKAIKDKPNTIIKVKLNNPLMGTETQFSFSSGFRGFFLFLLN